MGDVKSERENRSCELADSASAVHSLETHLSGTPVHTPDEYKSLTTTCGVGVSGSMVMSPTPGSSVHREALMLKSSAMFFPLLVTGESLTCTGSDDLSISVPFCCGSDSGETVDVKIDSFAGELRQSTRLGVASQISPNCGQGITVDSGACVQVSSLQWCLNRDEVHATVVKSFIYVDVQLISSSYNSVGVTTRRDSPSATPSCCTSLELGETVDLEVSTSASETGNFIRVTGV